MSNNDEKYRRMAIRRDIGNRKTDSAPENKDRSHPEYLVAHACFSCRKSFKMPPEFEHTCPKCGGVVHWMGRAFRTPKKKDEEQWLKVQKLYESGFRFNRYRGDYEALPERLKDVADFVKRNPVHPLRISEGQNE